MKKTLLVIVVLFTMISAFILNSGKPNMNMASDDDDGIIEWNMYSVEMTL